MFLFIVLRSLRPDPHISLNIRSQLQDEAEIIFFLYNSKSRAALSEEYCVRVSAQGVIQPAGKARCLFAALEAKDFDADLYVVARVNRVGRLESGAKGEGRFRRCALLRFVCCDFVCLFGSCAMFVRGVCLMSVCYSYVSLLL